MFYDNSFLIPFIIACFIAMPFVIGILCYIAKETKFSLKRYLNFKKEIFKKIFIIFCLCNIVIFSTVSIPRSVCKPYFMGKFFMYNALTINVLYLYPLDNIFTWNSIIVKPFRYIRDLFYNTGLLFYAKNEGEREYWYQTIKGDEYYNYVITSICKKDLYHNNIPFNKKYGNKTKITDRELLSLQKITKEIDSHIYKLMFQPIIDNNIREKRYTAAMALMQSNLWLHWFLFNINQPVESNTDMTEWYKKQIQLIKQFYLYSQKVEPESIKYLQKSNNEFIELSNITNILDSYLVSKYKNTEIDCEDPYIKLLVIASSKLTKETQELKRRGNLKGLLGTGSLFEGVMRVENKCTAYQYAEIAPLSQEAYEQNQERIEHFYKYNLWKELIETIE